MIPEINLLPSKERQRDRTSFFLSIIIIIWVILLGVILLQYYLTKSSNETLQSRVESLEMQKTALENQLQDQVPEVATSNYVESVEFAEKLTAPTSKIIKELNKHLPEYSYLTYYNYNVGQVNIQVEFDSLNRIAGYVTSLNKSEIFSDVKVDNISTFRLEEGATEGEEAEDTDTTVLFEEMPRYDVSFSLGINMPALLNDTGGGDNE